MVCHDSGASCLFNVQHLVTLRVGVSTVNLQRSEPRENAAKTQSAQTPELRGSSSTTPPAVSPLDVQTVVQRSFSTWYAPCCLPPSSLVVSSIYILIPLATSRIHPSDFDVDHTHAISLPFDNRPRPSRSCGVTAESPFSIWVRHSIYK
jgi:hypothetical protein